MTTNPHSQNTHNQPLFHANKRVTITQSRLRHYQDHIIQLTPMHYNEGGTSLKDMLELSSRGNDGRFCATKKSTQTKTVHRNKQKNMYERNDHVTHVSIDLAASNSLCKNSFASASLTQNVTF